MDIEKDLDKRLVAQALEALKNLEEEVPVSSHNEDMQSTEQTDQDLNLSASASELSEDEVLEEEDFELEPSDELSEERFEAAQSEEQMSANDLIMSEMGHESSASFDASILPQMQLEGLDFVEEGVEQKGAQNFSDDAVAPREDQNSVEDLAAAAAEAFAELNDGSDEIPSAIETLQSENNIEEMTDEERYMTENMSAESAQEQEIPQEFVEHSQLISIIESLLFATDKPMSVSTIHNAFKNTNIKPQHVRRALDELQSVYADSYRGVTLEEVHGGYQLRTKLDNAEFLKRMAKTRPFKLSGPALETMAILAYKQPITKSEIDSIRGVESGHLVRALMERGLVQFAGKSELPGRPMYYGTTKKFLDIFGLRNLNELPTLAEIDELIPEGIGAEEEKKETLSDLTDRLSEEAKSTYSEGEEELSKITDTLNTINTSSDFFEQEKQRMKEKRDADRANDIREALTVGESVEEKDVKWLARYERELEEKAKALEMAQLAAQTADTVAGSDESLAAALNELSESQLSASASETDEAVENAINMWDSEEELEVVRLDASSEEDQIEEISLMDDSADGEEASEQELDAFLGYEDDKARS